MVHLHLEVPERATHTLILVQSEICSFLQDFEAAIRYALLSPARFMFRTDGGWGKTGGVDLGTIVSRQIYVEPSAV
jgi:hypothetical protein